MLNKDQGGLSYQDWAAMTPWQREDFVLRMNKYIREKNRKIREKNKRK